MSKIGIASDHAGYEMKEFLVGYLDAMGYEVLDFGTHSPDSVDYADFAHPLAEAIENGELLEWAEFVGNYYGTPLKEVERLREAGKNVILEIEVQGCTQVKEKCPDAVTIFMIPPSMEELENRIRGRRSEPEEIIQQRLAKAQREMKMVKDYKYVVCNDDPQLAADVIALIIKRNM